MSINKILNYNFKNKNLLKESLTHPSMMSDNQNITHYERLEFLGDSVLNLIISEYLIKHYKTAPEGVLAKIRSALVCGEAITKIAEKICLSDFMYMNSSEIIAGGLRNPRSLEDCLEAVIGAIYLDGGMNEARKFIIRLWNDLINSIKDTPTDPKSELQEWAQKSGRAIPEYLDISHNGPAHSLEFEVEVRINSIEPVRARGRSKKLAQREAAKLLLEKIKK